MKPSGAVEYEPQILRDLFSDKSRQQIRDNVSRHLRYGPSPYDETFHRTYVHNMPFLQDVHRQLKDVASEVFGETVIPSYVFLSMYKVGGKCPLHIDRPQCRYTIDYLLEQGDSEPWPIAIGSPMTDVEREESLSIARGHPETQEDIERILSDNLFHEVLLHENDAVCYSGTHSWHYRPTQSKSEAVLIFFHFVPEGFKGHLH